MSDIEPMDSDDESRLFESFDQDQIKFNETSTTTTTTMLRRKKDMSNTNESTNNNNNKNQSIELYSTTYVSNSKKAPETSKTELEVDFDVFDNDSLGLLSDSEK